MHNTTSDTRMKQEAQTLHRHHPRRFRTRFATAASIAKPTAYLILLLLCYTLGYLSAVPASSRNSTSPTTLKSPTNLLISTPTSITRPPPPLAPEDHHNFFGSVCAAEPVPPQLVRQTIIDRVFNGTSPWDNFPPPHISRLLHPTKLRGWGSTAPVFDHLIRKVQPKTIIEVGTFLGASALHMARLTRLAGLHEGTQIICVDDFRGWPGFQQEDRHRRWFKDFTMLNGDVTLLYQFMQNVVSANATHLVSFLPFSTGSALEKLCEWGIFGDLIEVDAGHDFHSAWSDINRAYKILSPGGGGVLFGHDYMTAADNRGVRRAVNLFARLHNLRVQVHGQHWVLLHPSKQQQPRLTRH